MSLSMRYYTVNGRLIGERDKSAPVGRVDYSTDALGSVTATIDQDAAIENTYRYKPYGRQLAKTGGSADPNFLFVGAQGYRQTNIKHSENYVRARHRSALSGNWTTVDPLWPDERPYKYVEGNPTSFIDPTGLTRGQQQERKPGYRIGEGTPPPYLPQDCRDGRVKAEGVTYCDHRTGKPYAFICTSDCKAHCTELHERIHFPAIAECCRRYANCMSRAGGRAIEETKCERAWDRWRDDRDNVAIWECEAMKVSMDCFKFFHDEICLGYCPLDIGPFPPPTIPIPQSCCPELVAAYLADRAEWIINCENARGKS